MKQVALVAPRRPRAVTRIALVVAVVLGALTTTGVAWAEHEVFYRYTVLGYVKDARGKPVSGREVTVIRDKTGLAYMGGTDANGLYVVILRLGDESLGEQLTVRMGDITGKVTVKFDVANRTDERGTRVDLDGARFVDRAAWFPSTLTLLLDATRR